MHNKLKYLNQVHAKDNYSNTPLHEACRRGSTGMSKWLVSLGADINAKNNSGYTPLHDACWDGHTDMAKWLVSNGADINAKNDSGNTPLHLANNKLKKELEKEKNYDKN
jgi:ankyrin repeat protein